MIVNRVFNEQGQNFNEILWHIIESYIESIIDEKYNEIIEDTAANFERKAI